MSTEVRPNTSPASEGHQATVGTSSDSSTSGPSTDFHPAPPSETAPPTLVTTPPQQAATQPGTGGEVQTVMVEPPHPSFNQRVVGYAKEIRGTVLGKKDTKDYGGKIRKGEEPWPPSHEQSGSDTDAATSPTSPTSPTKSTH